MTRTERVMELQQLLRGRESTTVSGLAHELGVSRRTVLRDLATLRERGEPIESESGPGGGVRIVRDLGVVSVHLSVVEVIALWLGATLSSQSAPLPWSAASKRALQKVFASLPRDRARRLRQLVKRVVVGRPASARIYAELGKPADGLLAVVERAFAESVCLSFDYIDRYGAATERTVEPHGFMVETPAWYLLAVDVDRDAVRLFRFDRIKRARVMPERRFVADLDTVYRSWLDASSAAERRV